MDRLFWTSLRSVWSRWAEVLLIVGDRGGLASRRIPAVLALAVSRKSSWQSHNYRRNPGTHS